MLTVARLPHNDVSPHLSDKNAFECRTCPYQYVLDKRYYERKTMKRKEVEDVMGGADTWKNADKTEGEFCLLGLALAKQRRE